MYGILFQGLLYVYDQLSEHTVNVGNYFSQIGK